MAISVPPGVIKTVQPPPGKTETPGVGNRNSANVPDVYCSKRTLSAVSVKKATAPNYDEDISNNRHAIPSRINFIFGIPWQVGNEELL